MTGIILNTPRAGEVLVGKRLGILQVLEGLNNTSRSSLVKTAESEEQSPVMI